MKIICIMTFIVMFVFLAGCSNGSLERKEGNIDNIPSQDERQLCSVSGGSKEKDLNDSRESGDIEETSEKYGVFVDTQGTDSVYSSLVTWRGEDGEDEAVLSIYRQGVAEGSFVDNGKGELVFSSHDGSVGGIIKIDGQGGATFQVTETSGETPFSVGETFEFPTDGNCVGY